jgi:hypothetical protein
MSKQKSDKKSPAKPATEQKKTGKVTKVDDLELNKIVGVAAHAH